MWTRLPARLPRLAGLTLALMLCPGEPPSAADGPPAFNSEIQPFLNRYCVDCHRGDDAQGKLRLEQLTADVSSADARRRWRRLAHRLVAGEMPPAEALQPAADELGVVLRWIAIATAAGEAADRTASGRVVLRRLNRVEYERTLSDLLGVRLALQDKLPPDGAADGFDNQGAALHTSSFLMERYLDAADFALAEAIANLPRPPLLEKQYRLQDERHVKVTTENVFRKQDDALICFCSSNWHQVHLSQFYPRDGGLYRFRIIASAVQSDGQPVTYRVISGRTRLTGKDGLVGYFDAPADQPGVVEFVQHIPPQTTIAILPYGLATAQTVNKVGADDWTGPGLAVHSVEVEGPLYDGWPPESHRRLFGDLPQAPAPIYNQSKRVEVVSDQPLVDAERILRTFTRRAFRRAVTDDDVQPFVAVVRMRLEAGASFEQSVRAALKGVLLSPDFLFLVERPGPLDDFALASRLSYFLWSTLPDDELLSLAEQQRLRQPDVLRAQVERLLSDPRAAAFTENFLGQWLNLRQIDFTEPSHILYPEYDHLLKVSMLREAELYFEELLRHDLGVSHLVASEFAMLNGRLARHYGLPGPAGWEFEQTPLPAGSRRGGFLTMAGVMKVTANGTTTSPVVRGAWVLDRLLGTPPAPPPDEVDAIDPDIRGATTIREQLDKHRSVAACAACHAHIDPPGFALESFDCIGGWRDRYRSTGLGESVTIDGRRMPYLRGKPVDPSGVLPDGRRFEDIDGFRQLLLEDPDRLARALLVRLATYATGGAPTPADDPEIERILTQTRPGGHGVRALVHAVVQSEMFRHK